MASNRHLGRIVALQTLYEQDFRLEAGDAEFDLDAVLKRNTALKNKTGEVSEPPRPEVEEAA
jgi:hypothetical protein